MILSRLKNAIREQNWFAVVLELLIVVLGVFIGLQVDNWNQARARAENERAMLIRLQEEFESVEDELAQAAENYELTVRSTGQLIEMLRVGTPPVDEMAFKDVLRAAQFVWGTPAQSATYSEMVSTGALSHLSSPELRAALTRYGNYTAKYARQLPQAMDVVLNPNSNYLQAVKWSPDTDEWFTADAIVSYDWNLLIRSQAELQSWLAYQVDLRSYTQGQLEEIRTILSLLEADL